MPEQFFFNNFPDLIFQKNKKKHCISQENIQYTPPMCDRL